MTLNLTIVPEGDSALLIRFEQKIDPAVNAQVLACMKAVREMQIEGISDLVPGYASLLVCYRPQVISYKALKERLAGMEIDTEAAAAETRTVVIPVCYGGEYGPDLAACAKRAGMSEEAFTALHCSVSYPVYMLGFMPGFPYLGGLDERLVTPRLETPRVKIPAGSVGIVGSQTGIYPMDSPGGWNLIGRTPLKIYDPMRQEPFLIHPGDLVRFVPVDEEEYHRLAQEVL